MSDPLTKQKRGSLNIDLSFGRVSLTQKLLFAKNMSLMLRSGLSIVEALDAAQDSSGPALKKILKGIANSVQAGNSLAESMARYPRVFSGFFINAVRTGEASGTLEGNLAYASVQLEKDQEIRSKVKGAMLYPAIVVSATFVLGLVLSFVVLPKITPLFEGMHMELPFTTRVLLWFSHLIQNYGILLVVGIIIFVISFTILLRQKFTRPFNHAVLLHLPVFSNLVRNAALARFSLTSGTLMKAGIPLVEGFVITIDAIGNHFYEQALRKVSQEVEKGGALSEALSRYPKLFPPLLTRMIQVGEKSGKLEETFLYLSNYYEREVDMSAKSLTIAIEPILLLIIGGVVGFLALSIITPIYNITGSIH